ncbi:alpha/beta hydrolase [Synechococcus sp. RedBA-s]|uniref:alpha/beta hydrolase n=1 Tax=Synechococcus sp. RedBA-s TaxID=2823741 RepID=UPI0020CE5E1D|nr:alpha/beta hydrolase [Synechococcus sp. RedBA-s]MCP9799282.1 dienelactone hydrolase [Synechococcus sp. RedBA-s]
MSALRSASAAPLLLTISGLLGAALVLPVPARALEQVELRLPFLEFSFSVKLEELSNPASLLSGTSDLAELNQATSGAVGRQLIALFNAPLPLQVPAVVNEAEGSPMLNQALLLVSALGGIDGLPAQFNGNDLSRVLDKAAAQGPLTMLSVMRTLPGSTASVDLGRALFAVRRLASQQQPADRLLAGRTPASVSPALSQPGPLTVERKLITLPAPHRPKPLQVVQISPSQGANGRLVVISHGLWDAPESFEGWASHLASHGYTVLLPYHPGSDQGQQQAMLSGKVPPPGGEELRLRPLDVSAVIDGAAAGLGGLSTRLNTDFVVALGQSWGATTVLQLAGAKPNDLRLKERCDEVLNPERNLSWVLQCSFIGTANQAALADPRVKAGVAVSPPMSLLFDTGASQRMNARVLLVSGSRDWVVPPDPEAIRPMQLAAARGERGHRLVLAQGGDHFNLRSTLPEGGGSLRGLLLAWTNGAFAAGDAVLPAPGAPDLLPANGWGDVTVPLVEFSPAQLGTP